MAMNKRTSLFLNNFIKFKADSYEHHVSLSITDERYDEVVIFFDDTKMLDEMIDALTEARDMLARKGK